MIDTNEVLDCAMGDWGEPVIVDGQTITGIFDEPFVGASPFGHGVESSDPQIVCKTADLTAETDHGTAVTVRGKSYTVSGKEDNGLGETVLTLRAE